MEELYCELMKQSMQRNCRGSLDSKCWIEENGGRAEERSTKYYDCQINYWDGSNKDKHIQ